MTQQEMVQEFRDTFGVPTPKVPTMPDLETRRLMCKLIVEEALEFCEAAGFDLSLDGEVLLTQRQAQPNLNEMMDATADLKYVTIGAERFCGVDGDAVFSVVHQTNMAKTWTPEQVEAYQFDTESPPLHFEEVDGMFPLWVARNAAGKIIKPDGWKKPDIEKELKRQAEK